MVLFQQMEIFNILWFRTIYLDALFFFDRFKLSILRQEILNIILIKKRWGFFILKKPNESRENHLPLNSEVRKKWFEKCSTHQKRKTNSIERHFRFVVSCSWVPDCAWAMKENKTHLKMLYTFHFQFLTSLILSAY